jgi:hypothetical protein
VGCVTVGFEQPARILVYVLFTSGSTGHSQGRRVEHRQLVNYVDSISEVLDLPPGSSYASVSTFAADLGNTAVFPALCSGGTLHVISQDRVTDAEAFAEYCSRHSIDCLKIVPSHLQALLTAPRPERALPKRRLVLGGEAAGWPLISKVHELAPDCIVFNHYGPTKPRWARRRSRSPRTHSMRARVGADRQTDREGADACTRLAPRAGSGVDARRDLHRRGRSRPWLLEAARGDRGAVHAQSRSKQAHGCIERAISAAISRTAASSFSAETTIKSRFVAFESSLAKSKASCISTGQYG